MTREEAIKRIKSIRWEHATNTCQDRTALDMAIKALEQEPKTEYCKDCKWWEDSDGTYRRGVHAESKCPINHREVFEGNGYCYMFEPKVQEVEE